MEYFYFFPLNESPYFKLGVTNDIETRMNTHKREFAKKGFTFNLDEVTYYEAPNRKITEKIIEEQFKIVYSKAVDWSEEIFMLEHLTEVISYCENWGKRMGLSDQRKYTPIPKRNDVQKVSLPKKENRKYNPDNKKWTPIHSVKMCLTKPHESGRIEKSIVVFGMRVQTTFLDGSQRISYIEPNTNVYRYYYGKDLEFGSYTDLNPLLKSKSKRLQNIQDEKERENQNRLDDFIKAYVFYKNDIQLIDEVPGDKDQFVFYIIAKLPDIEVLSERYEDLNLSINIPENYHSAHCLIDFQHFGDDNGAIRFSKTEFRKIELYRPDLFHQLPEELKTVINS